MGWLQRGADLADPSINPDMAKPIADRLVRQRLAFFSLPWRSSLPSTPSTPSAYSAPVSAPALLSPAAGQLTPSPGLGRAGRRDHTCSGFAATHPISPPLSTPREKRKRKLDALREKHQAEQERAVAADAQRAETAQLAAPAGAVASFPEN